MADEVVQPTAEAEQQPPAVAPTGAEPGQQTEAARTFTQADVDRIVAERLERAERKAADKAEKARQDAEAQVLKEQGKFQELYQKAQADLERLAAEKRSLELAALRRDVAAKFQLPDGLAKRLQGETTEELERDAQDLLAAIPKPAAPDINAGNAPARVNGNVYGGLSEKEFAARFGVRADLLGK
jgi:hypothetical protein